MTYLLRHSERPMSEESIASFSVRVCKTSTDGLRDAYHARQLILSAGRSLSRSEEPYAGSRDTRLGADEAVLVPSFSGYVSHENSLLPVGSRIDVDVSRRIAQRLRRASAFFRHVATILPVGDTLAAAPLGRTCDPDDLVAWFPSHGLHSNAAVKRVRGRLPGGL